MRFSCALALLSYALTARYGSYLREHTDAVHTYASVSHPVSTFATFPCDVKLSQADSFAVLFSNAACNGSGHADAGLTGAPLAAQATQPAYPHVSISIE